MNVLNSFQNRKYKNIFIISSLILALIAAILRTVGILFFYEKESAYFADGSFLPIILYTFIILAIVFFILGAVFTVDPKKEVPTPSKKAKTVAIFPALAMVAFVFMNFNNFKSLYEAVYLVERPDPTKLLPFVYTCGLLISATVCVLFFLAFSFKNSNSKTVLGLSIAFFAWGILNWITSYIEFMTPINSPDKMFFHLACISALLFMVSELRSMHSISKPKFYYFSLATSITLLATSSIPCLIGAFCSSFKSDILIPGNIVLFALLIYFSVRAVTLVCEKEKTPEAENVSDSELVKDEENAD